MRPLSVRPAVRDETVAVVEVRGDVDLTTVERLRADLDVVLERRPPNVIVDLADVDFFSARGLSTLLDADAEATNAGGSLTLVAPSTTVRRVLALTGTQRRFRVRPTVGQAIAALA